MGCGASAAQGGEVFASAEAKQEKPVANGHITNGTVKSNGVAHNKTKNSKPPIDKDKPVPKPVAFEVDVDDKENNNNNSTQAVLHKPPPKRIRELAPLRNAPALTADMLAEKMRLAEEKRSQELDKKRAISRRTSRLKMDILRAQEFEKTHQTQQEIEDKQRSAGRVREAQRLEMESKRLAREDRAKRNRERARRLREGEPDDDELEIEKDEGFNADDGDSWLGDDDPMSQVSDWGERIYSGRESPRKTPRKHNAPHRGLSASTTDSFDFAFQRDSTNMSFSDKQREFDEANDDNFFDS